MKKRNGWLYAFWILFIVLVILCLAVGLISWAGTEADESDAEEPATEVSDAEGLVEALEEGGEITLAGDIVNITETLEVSADTVIDLAGNSITTAEGLSDATNTIEVDEDVTLTIVDNGGDESGTISNAYTGAASTDNAAAIYSKGEVIVESGTIESESIGIKTEGGSVTINGGAIESEYFSIWGSGETEITINGGTISGESKGIYVGGDASYGYSDYQTGTTTLNVAGGEISCASDSAICTLGTANSSSAEINILGGTITSDAEIVYEEDGSTVKTAAPTIYLPNGNLNISGGTIKSANLTAVEVRGGSVSVTGGALVGGNSKKGDDASPEKSGAKTYGYALSVYPYQHTNRSSQEDFDNTVNVSVTGGTFTGDIYVAATAEKASKGETLWTVDFEGTTEGAPYVVKIGGDAITATTTKYDSTGSLIADDQGDETEVSYYVVTVTANSEDKE